VRASRETSACPPALAKLEKQRELQHGCSYVVDPFRLPQDLVCGRIDR